MPELQTGLSMFSVVCAILQDPLPATMLGFAAQVHGFVQDLNAATRSVQEAPIMHAAATKLVERPKGLHLTAVGRRKEIGKRQQGIVMSVLADPEVKKYKMSHIRCGTVRHERGCAACPGCEQGKSTLRRLAAVKTR
jgi:hypothetical protein